MLIIHTQTPSLNTSFPPHLIRRNVHLRNDDKPKSRSHLLRSLPYNSNTTNWDDSDLRRVSVFYADWVLLVACFG